MSAWPRFLLLPATVLLLMGCNSQKARNEVKAGVKAYNAANYQLAIEHFQNATRLDDHLMVAKLDLANSYAMLWMPGVDSPENIRAMEETLGAYNAVLAADPKNVTGLKSAAILSFLAQRYDPARSYLQRLLQADPNDPEAYYDFAVVDWMTSFRDIQNRRNAAGVGPSFPGICDELKTADGPRIEEGLKMAESAMNRRSGYRNAMMYASLLYELRAATECQPPGIADDNTLAAKFRQQALSTPEQKAPDTQLAEDEVPAFIAAPLPPPPPPPPPPPATQVAASSPGIIPDSPKAPSAPQKIRIPSSEAEANLIHKVDPVYPNMAKVAHIQGDAVVQVTVAKDGTVQNARAVSGHPMLIQPALDAVKQWRYKPFLHNDELVEVETTITVKFRM